MNAELQPAPTSRFTKIASDGSSLPPDAKEWATVTDARTGLMWAVKPIAVRNWKPAAIKKVEAELAKTKLGGFDDWRIPTVEELFPLADRARHNPAIDPDFFPDCPSDWFWTSTPYAPSPGDYAWFVHFGDGFTSYYGRGAYGFVRAVRGGQ